MKKTGGSEKVETFYVTKWGLTQGILKVKGICSKVIDGMVFRCKSDDPDSWVPATHVYGLGKDFHTTLEYAKARVGEMQLKKIASLERQLKKMHTYKPVVVDHT